MKLSLPLLLGVASWADNVLALPNGFLGGFLSNEKREPADAAATLPSSCTRTQSYVKSVFYTPTSYTTTTIVVSRTKTALPTKYYTTTPKTTGTTTVTTTTTLDDSTTVTVSSSVTTVDGGSSTTTVGSGPSFTAVQDSLAGTSCDDNCGDFSSSKRDLQVERDFAIEARQPCKTTTVIRATSTVTATVSSTVTSTRTTRVFTTTTVTPTTTIFRASNTLATSTATITAFSTTVSVAGSTTTTFEVTTVYDVCSPSNFADTYNGEEISKIDAYDSPLNSYYVSNSSPSPYDCCTQGASDTDHQYAVFQYDVAHQVCYINYVSDDAPPNNQTDSTWGVDQLNGPQIVIGNLYNGIINSGP